MIVVSCFDGMSCGMIAAERVGLNVTEYHAFEIDKHAIEVSNRNYPDIIHHGDINQWKKANIDWHKVDLLIGGSPCQGFSFAGKQLAFDDPRSVLFFKFVEILRYIRLFNPNVKFLLENVKMKKDHLNVISDTLGVEPVFINSALVSAQNRQRYYWCNWSVPQPEDKGIMLSDILETEGVGVLKDRGSWRESRYKANCVDANYWKGVDNHAQRTMVSTIREHVLSEKALSRLERKKYSKPQLLPEKTGTLNTKNNSGQLSFDSGTTLIPFEGTLRKLTPIECERLQTVPDGYTDHVSNTQRYKMLGNGWTVDVIAHIFKEMIK